MKPKEHGAYAILLIPMVTSFLSWGITTSGVCVALAAFAGFMAHEPLLVMIGNRGARAQRNAPSAWERCSLLVVVALLLGSYALVQANGPARIGLVACLLLAVVGFVIAVRGKHRTYAGQLLGVASLSAPSLAISLLAGAAWQTSVSTWCTWLLGFAATTSGVRSVIAAQKQKPRFVYLAAMVVLTTAAILLLLPLKLSPLSCLPMVLAGWYLHFCPPPVRQIRRVGWTLVGVTLFTAILQVAIVLRS